MYYLFILAGVVGIISAIIDHKYKTKLFRYIMVFMLGMITMLTIQILEMINEIIK